MRVVSPYRPFPLESIEHQNVGPFDWVAALRMLAVSVERSCNCETLAITDVDTLLPVPAIRLRTTERRLMLWILDVSLQYLKSEAFDVDTVMVSPDTLVTDNLARFFVSDLGLVIRPESKFKARPIINSVQWWKHSGKKRLIAFYEQALQIARTLPEDLKVWGADSEPLRQLVEPIAPGVYIRSGVKVSMLQKRDLMESITEDTMTQLREGTPPYQAPVPIIDFRYGRKHYMQAYFDATIGNEVPA
jgi:hypothetical protein